MHVIYGTQSKHFSSNCFQKMLQRHVNQHFASKEERTNSKKVSDTNAAKSNASSVQSSIKAAKKGANSSKVLDSIGPYGVKALIESQNSGIYLARKSAMNPAAMKFSSSTKNLKRVGVRLKYRKSVFSARNFDFFDAGVMAGVKDAVNHLETTSRDLYKIDPKLRINFEVLEILGVRNVRPDGRRTVLVRWSPKNL